MQKEAGINERRHWSGTQAVQVKFLALLHAASGKSLGLAGLAFPICQMETMDASFCLAFIVPVYIVVQRKKKRFLKCVCIVPNILEAIRYFHNTVRDDSLQAGAFLMCILQNGFAIHFRPVPKQCRTFLWSFWQIINVIVWLPYCGCHKELVLSVLTALRCYCLSSPPCLPSPHTNTLIIGHYK